MADHMAPTQNSLNYQLALVFFYMFYSSWVLTGTLNPWSDAGLERAAFFFFLINSLLETLKKESHQPVGQFA